MKEIFHELESVLREYNPHVLDTLALGLDTKTVQENLATAGIKYGDWAEIYCWRNGFKEAEFLMYQDDFCSWGKLMSLETSIDLYKENVKNGTWSRDFFPLVDEGGGGYLLINLNTNHPGFGMIHVYAPHLLIVDNPETAYDSFHSFIETLIACYKNQIYTSIDEGSTLDIDDEQEQEISKIMNPKSVFWNED